ncbi:uncharacterized protein [Montipora capricornis]|uniref:uncharacterized protein n=1 Tax=Montipora capricornis TaxID=246305 RepID=UPI0035F1B021
MASKRVLGASSKEGPSSKKRKIVGKGHESKGKSSSSATTSNSKSLSAVGDLPKRDKHGKLVFADFPDFKPNMTPKEVLRAGSFGGTYFRPIYSSVTGKKYSADVYKEFPADWFEGLKIKAHITSSVYRNEVNTYKVKCGGSLEMWESSGWIHKQDPYGWFQWYCRFYLGRRTEDDSRQVDRWKKCAGDKGRWRNNLIAKIVRSGCAYDNFNVSPVVRQTLQHWGYKLNKEDFDKYAKKVKV